MEPTPQKVCLELWSYKASCVFDFFQYFVYDHSEKFFLIERSIESEIAKSREAKALVLCKAKMSDP
ncbi:hypothetical protein BWD12_10235 [Leptospira santarosai serovar Bananal]|nr:hypothetical protein BWD11_12765 [Leptospira santarosai serovar Grippotyphosa]ONF79160.1 hypothetical protein BWD12_10235 [Leptospira santarosai serovar Bananal]